MRGSQYAKGLPKTAKLQADMKQRTVRVDFEPVGKRVDVPAGTNLLAAAQEAGVEIASVCGGMGTCKRCRVQTISGDFASPNVIDDPSVPKQEIGENYQLACLLHVMSPCKVFIPPDSLTTPQRLQLEGSGDSLLPDHRYSIIDLELVEPSLDDLRSDLVRLKEGLVEKGYPDVGFRFPLLSDLSERLRQYDWHIRLVLKEGEAVAVLTPGRQVFGLAIDIGTTKVAAYLLDMENGHILSQKSAMNPQIHYGEDVVSRIYYCMENVDGRQMMQRRIVSTLNDLITDLCGDVNALPEQIVDAVVVGNTAMHHLFAGLPVQQLGLMPFVPAVSQSLDIPSFDMGLTLSPGASVYLPPNIAGYVGADHVSMVLATNAYRTEGTVLAVDIGTNTEISLVHKGEIYCCSCASGPAFEGAHIREGMRAVAGAIEKVQIDHDKVRIMTIGNAGPVGICGSGILDAVAEMVRTGLINKHGVLTSGSTLIRGTGKDSEFILVKAEETGCGRDLTINRRDINEILLAKAAIRTGIEVLLEKANISADIIERFIIAGAFGTYLDIRSTIQIGMFPDLPLDRFEQVGNAAGSGARQMLVSKKHRKIADELADRMQYVELTSHDSFKKTFLKSMDFMQNRKNINS
jgi:uncharacterized 2Fe-2S/4Fe-4S cluster protein (DUF4445 family)